MQRIEMRKFMGKVFVCVGAGKFRSTVALNELKDGDVYEFVEFQDCTMYWIKRGHTLYRKSAI